MPIKVLMKDFFVPLIFLCFLSLGACAPLQFNPTSTLGSSEFTGFVDSKEVSYRPGQENSYYYKAFPEDDNQYIDKWLAYFSTGNGKDSMGRYLERSNRYLALMKSIFEEKGLPQDLVYISMAESGFFPYAKSTANAVGYWQFIYPTAQSYGLKIDKFVDERQDFVLSTQAAASYLKNLYDIFEDWRLSMAAYNYGEHRVKKAISNYNSKDFWYLSEQKSTFPTETRDYIPKIIAMRKIALQPKAYGFTNLKYEEPLDYKLVSLRGSSSSSLSSVSRQLNVSQEELKSLNPKFKTDSIPIDNGKTQIRVPAHVEF